MTRIISSALALSLLSASAGTAFADENVLTVTTLENGTLPANQGAVPVPAAALHVVEAYRAELTRACADDGKSISISPSFVAAVDVNGDGVPDLFMSAESVRCDGASAGFSGSAGSGARWAISRPDGGYRSYDMLYHTVEVQQTLRSGWQLILHLHGSACGKSGADQCRQVVNFSGDTMKTITWPDGNRNVRSKSNPLTAAAGPTPVNMATGTGASAPAVAPADAAVLARLNTATAKDGFETLDHNGSGVAVNERDGIMVYETPKSAMSGTVQRGTILFRGTFDKRGTVRGTAHVFKRGCEPEPYAVSGQKRELQPYGYEIVLRGAAPRRDPNSCAIVGTTNTGPNSRLVFSMFGDI